VRFVAVVVHHLHRLDHGSIVSSRCGSSVLCSGVTPFDYTWSGRRRWSSFSAPPPAMVFSLDAAVACGLRTRRHLLTPDQAPPAIFVELFDPPPLRLVRDRLDLFLQSDWLTRWLLFGSAHTASSARLTQFFDSAHAATSGSGLFVRFGFHLF
jgi:hypothetical protein